MAQIFGYQVSEEAYFSSPRTTMFSGVQSPEEKIYIAFRCSDTHESGIPGSLKYVFDNGLKEQTELKLFDGEFHFTSGLLNMLERVIVEAPSNGKEFDIQHFRMLPKSGLDLEEIYSFFLQKHELSKGRVDIIRRILALYPPEVTSSIDSELIANLNWFFFNKLPESMKTGLCVGMFKNPPCKKDKGFTEHGLIICRDVIDRFERVDIAS